MPFPPIPGLTDSQIVDIMLQWHNKFYREALEEWKRLAKDVFPEGLRTERDRRSLLEGYYYTHFNAPK